MRRVKIVFLVLGLAALLVSVFGCGDERSTSDVTGPGVQLLEMTSLNNHTQGALPYPILDPRIPWHGDLDVLEYETLEAPLNPANGGFFSLTMNTWVPKCTFGVMVPVGAGNDNEYTFSLSVPTKEMYDTYIDLPLILRMEPSNVIFASPIEVWAYYMPWEKFPFQDDETAVFRTGSDPDAEYILIPPEERDIIRGKHRLHATFPHFSDWDLLDCKAGTPPCPSLQ